jgi:hypothetical protein
MRSLKHWTCHEYACTSRIPGTWFKGPKIKGESLVNFGGMILNFPEIHLSVVVICTV